MRQIGIVLLSILISGCAVGTRMYPNHPAQALPLSGPVEQVPHIQGDGVLPLIGLVSDPQIQTRQQNSEVRWWRNRRLDKAIEVTIRPPALDWSSRFLLEGFLHELRARGAKAIFLLGDGANNGCHDEFLEGFERGRSVGMPARNDRGVLRLLDDFRKAAKIPVYFVLGNHDFMAAGSSSQVRPRWLLCTDNPHLRDTNRPLSRFEVIEAIDAFNRGNGGLSAEFSPAYRSNVNSELRSRCLRGAPPLTKNELRNVGCYYAAILDYPNRVNPTAQLLLADTTDNADVSSSRIGGLQVESMRGAMSFKDPHHSQTSWFRGEMLRDIPLRLVLSHYPVKALPKLNWLGMGGYSQRFMDLFVGKVGDDMSAEPLQTNAFVLSGHTHGTGSADRRSFKAYDRSFEIGEFNVGSTTDSSVSGSTISPPHAALIRIERLPTPAIRDSLQYERVHLPSDVCPAFYRELGPAGLQKFGIVEGDRKNYRRMSATEKLAVFRALDQFETSSTPEQQAVKARCIGLLASQMESAPR